MVARMPGHVIERMRDHYSSVGIDEKHVAVASRPCPEPRRCGTCRRPSCPPARALAERSPNGRAWPTCTVLQGGLNRHGPSVYERYSAQRVHGRTTNAPEPPTRCADVAVSGGHLGHRWGLQRRQWVSIGDDESLPVRRYNVRLCAELLVRRRLRPLRDPSRRRSGRRAVLHGLRMCVNALRPAQLAPRRIGILFLFFFRRTMSARRLFSLALGPLTRSNLTECTQREGPLK
jgi:hypothetical protein